MEAGEAVLGDDIVEGPFGKTALVVSTRAFYLNIGGRFTRYRHEDVRAATFDVHDIFLALDGAVVRLKCRQGTAKSQAIEALKRQIALHRFSAA
jgi:hypothetical protein